MMYAYEDEMSKADILKGIKESEISKSELSGYLDPEQNKVSEDSYTCLIMAIQSQHLAMVDALCTFGVDPDVPYGQHKVSALNYACDRSMRDDTVGYKIVDLLLACGADKEFRDRFDYTSLMSATGRDYDQIVRLLLEAGADIHAIMKKSGETALHVAAERTSVKAMKVLLEFGADVTAKNNDGKTSLDLLDQSSGDKDTKACIKLLKNPPKPTAPVIASKKGKTAPVKSTKATVSKAKAAPAAAKKAVVKKAAVSEKKPTKKRV